jgi:hypothetical protein
LLSKFLHRFSRERSEECEDEESLLRNPPHSDVRRNRCSELVCSGKCESDCVDPEIVPWVEAADGARESRKQKDELPCDAMAPINPQQIPRSHRELS